MMILFFSPYSFINVHNYPEAIVAESLRSRGHRVIMVRCKGLYQRYCIAMSTLNLKPDSDAALKQEICTACNKSRGFVEREFGFETLYIDDFIDQDDLDFAEQEALSLTMQDWPTVQTHGMPIARYAAYEYLLIEKINSIEFDVKLWPGYLSHFKNALLTASGGKRILEKYHADALVTYNSVYSCNHIMCTVADNHGIPHYTLHAGSHHKYRLSEMTIFKGLISPYFAARTTAWQRFSRRPLSETSIRRAAEHVQELLEAKSPWVYSIKSNNLSSQILRDKLKIPKGARVLLATMASDDERFSANLIDALPSYQQPLFASQAEWLQATMRWVSKRPDLFLIIRVHPREFPNKRETVLSKNAIKLKETLISSASNIFVNWPSDELSLHDIAKITDVGLNATSTAGFELLLFGLPVVIYDKHQLFSYPAEINLQASTVDGYFETINLALLKGRSIENIRNAFRWIAFKSEIVAVDISDVYREDGWEEGKNSARKSNLRRFYDRILFFWGSPRLNETAYADPNVLPRRPLISKNAKWLAYAIEHRKESHVDAYCSKRVRWRFRSHDKERKMIVCQARIYLDKLGFDTNWLGL